MRCTSDVDSLICAHMHKYVGDRSLHTFRRSWTAYSFSFIQNARLLESLEGEHEQTLYSAAISLITGDTASATKRIMAIYVIYMLYFTQQASPRVRIYTSLKELKQLCELAQVAKKSSLFDVIHVLRLLIKNKAFSVGIHLERLPRRDAHHRIHRKSGSKGDSPEVLMAAQISDHGIEDSYFSSKSKKVGEQVAIFRTGCPELHTIENNALRYLPQNRIPSAFHEVVLASRAYSSAAILAFKGSQNFVRVNDRADSRRVGCTHSRIARQMLRGDAKLRASLRAERET